MLSARINELKSNNAGEGILLDILDAEVALSTAKKIMSAHAMTLYDTVSILHTRREILFGLSEKIKELI